MAKRYDLYNIKEATDGKKARWNKLGTAFENKDGSFNLHLDGLPTDGKLHMRLYVPKEDNGQTFGE